MIEPDKNIVNLERTAVLQNGRYEKLRLDKNEIVSQLPEEVIKSMLSDVSSDFLTAYPEPFELVQKLADYHQVQSGNIMLSSGSEMAIRYVFEAFLRGGRDLLILEPSFAMFEVYGNICGAKIDKIPYRDDWTIDINSLLNRAKNVRGIIAIANPNNPTGTVIQREVLNDLLSIVESTGSLLMVDEAYYYFFNESMDNLIGKSQNLIVTRTFSKAAGLASIRLGYAMGHEKILNIVQKLQPIDPVNSFAVKLGSFILDHLEIVYNNVRTVVEGKDFLILELRNLGFQVMDSYANFILVDMGDLKRKEKVLEHFREKGILVSSNLRIPGKETFLRIGAGPRLQMERVVSCFNAI